MRLGGNGIEAFSKITDCFFGYRLCQRHRIAEAIVGVYHAEIIVLLLRVMIIISR